MEAQRKRKLSGQQKDPDTRLKPKKKRRKVPEIIERARAAFHTGQIPDHLTSRESEEASIFSFLRFATHVLSHLVRTPHAHTRRCSTQ